jgi:hypothetical protein
VAQHAVLVDARLVGEGVLAHDRLVARHGMPVIDGDQAAGRASGACRRRSQAEVALARLQRHHDLLERAVAGPLADAVDRALHLTRAGLHRGQAVGHRHAEVVVAMDR